MNSASTLLATVLFFGSARAKSTQQYQAAMADLLVPPSFPLSRHSNSVPQAQKEALGDDPAVEAIDSQIERVKAGEWMCEMFDKVVDLSRQLTEWSINSGIQLALGRRIAGVTRYHGTVEPENHGEDEKTHQTFLICTGGGPGFMEAANMGAAQVPNSKNIGVRLSLATISSFPLPLTLLSPSPSSNSLQMAISLPFEEGINRFVTDELAFQYHYFFTRKFWMMYYCQALVVAPGGVGTMDELFEVLTLKQTGKVQADLPVVLLGAVYWRTIINWEVCPSLSLLSLPPSLSAFSFPALPSLHLHFLHFSFCLCLFSGDRGVWCGGSQGLRRLVLHRQCGGGLRVHHLSSHHQSKVRHSRD
jgi:predicted Rossmann-fold nucleotide-binding protein